jgi:hypothetical protein
LGLVGAHLEEEQLVVWDLVVLLEMEEGMEKAVPLGVLVVVL